MDPPNADQLGKERNVSKALTREYAMHVNIIFIATLLVYQYHIPVDVKCQFIVILQKNSSKIKLFLELLDINKTIVIVSLAFQTDFGVERTRLLFPLFTAGNVNVFIDNFDFSFMENRKIANRCPNNMTLSSEY